MPTYGPSEHITIGGAGPSTNSTDVEYGVRVTFAVAGRITAVRYYRRSDSANDLHLRCWDVPSGTKLFDVACTSGSSSTGLFTETLGTPLLIPAGATREFTIGSAGSTPATTTAAQSVTNSTNCTFNAYRYYLFSHDHVPNTTNASATYFVEPVFEPESTDLTGAGSVSFAFSASATGSAFTPGAASCTFTFTATATGAIYPSGTTSITFTATATGVLPLTASASASMWFRAFAWYGLAVRDRGRWSATVNPGDTLTSDPITVAPGSLLVVLYALRVNGIATLLANTSEWGFSGTGPLTAITDTFPEPVAWVGDALGDFQPSGDVHSSMVATGLRALTTDTYDTGTVSVHTAGTGTHPAFAWLNIIEVQQWSSYFEEAGGNLETPPADGTVTAVAGDFTQDKIHISIGMADLDTGGMTITAPREWRPLQHDANPSPALEVATGYYRSRAPFDTEATSYSHDWSGMPTTAHSGVALSVAVVAAAPTPLPVPFAEFMVEYMNADGEWVDITCDVRTADIDSGRQDYLEQFQAATATLVFANFEDRYSGWPPDSVWADGGGNYRTDVPIRVNMFTLTVTGGVVAFDPHHLFSGFTDSVSDSWPGPGIDAMVTVTASDAFKHLARLDAGGLGKDAAGNDITVGAGDYTGRRIERWAEAVGYPPELGPAVRSTDTLDRDLDHGLARMDATTLAANALQAMQDSAFAEGLGLLYVRADGVLIFRQRDALQTDPRMTTVQATFTDRDGDPAGACYGDITPVVDDTSVYNIARFTPHDGLPDEFHVDDSSVAWFGPRTYPPTNLGVYEALDAGAAAVMVVVTHADNDRRVDSITIDAARDQVRWDVATTLQLMDRVRVVRHYPGGYLLDRELLVQGISHHLEGTGERVPGIWSTTYRTAAALDTAGFCTWDAGEWDTCSWGI